MLLVYKLPKARTCLHNGGHSATDHRHDVFIRQQKVNNCGEISISAFGCSMRLENQLAQFMIHIHVATLATHDVYPRVYKCTSLLFITYLLSCGHVVRV